MTAMSKISRNAPCPCGSGKKYKRCCLSKAQAKPVAEAPPPAPHATPVAWIEDEDDLDELSNRAVDLIGQGKLDEAETVGHDLCQRYPQVPDGLERLAATYEARGDFAKAAAYYRQAADLIHGAVGYEPETEQFYRDQAETLEQKASS